ncbi:MAG TPA: sigma-70 family RNA polymerase sigma factor [Candidatus Angelobacter sp.]|nr:sigma-70 family RNA polymerase sigma factor [Candidatus Angelobacter sp.]
MTDSQRLLADYAKTGSEAAFRELVSRYVNLVYSVAVRLVDGDTHLAEDVAQIVFADLARFARTLSKDVMPGGWLHRHTCFVAAKTMRSNRRRQFRERQAVEMNVQQDHSVASLSEVGPILDEAINRLGAKDRAAILLRFFEQRDLRSVGEALGSSENAAQKRVTHALEELRSMLKRRGIALSAAVLATALAGEAVTAAPSGLAVSIASAALTGAATAGGTGLTLLKLMTMTKLKAGIVAAVAVAGVATPLAIQHQTQTRLRAENQSLRERADNLASENTRLSNLGTPTNISQLSKDQLSELMKLRGEVGLLRRQTNELGRLEEENRRLQASLARAAQNARQSQIDSATEQEKQEALAKQQFIAKMGYARNWVLAFHEYAGAHQGQSPASFDQAATFLPDQARDETLLATNQFEIMYQGSLNVITNPATVIVLRESEAQPVPTGGQVRTYGFADGHSEVHKTDDGNFEPWEKQHMISAAQPGQ